MADANAVSLQNAINRFARVAGFNAIAVDGAIGNESLLGARRALDYLSVGMDDGLPEVVSDQAAHLNAKTTTNALVLATNAGPLAGFLNHAANLLKLPVVIAPPRSGMNIATNAVNQTFSLTPPPNGGAASIVDTLKALPTWQKVLLGALFGFGVLWAHQEYSKPRGA